MQPPNARAAKVTESPSSRVRGKPFGRSRSGRSTLHPAGPKRPRDRRGRAGPLATRINALGTISHTCDTDTVRPWLHGVVEAFGAERCMLGSDLPIETLGQASTACTPPTTRSSNRIPRMRRLLFGDTARRLYGGGSPG